VFIKHQVVREGRRAVVRYDGRVVDVLGAGRHRLRGRWRRRTVEVVDVRDQLLVLTGQELAAADVPGVRVSASARWAVTDPVAFLDASADPVAELRMALQLAVRDWAAAAPLAELLAGRAEAAQVLTARVAAEAARLGVTVAEASVRDVSVPGELRRALLATATAVQEGQAALERARGEVAATRALANAARMLAENPALLQLRTVQEAAKGAGSKVVVRVGDPTTP
jgi:regulator of protease activity HflC (stomatin/prohibitin superfamily)